MRTRYKPGHRVVFTPSYEQHVQYEGVIIDANDFDASDYDYRVTITKRITWTDPQRHHTTQPRHLLRETVPALEAELTPILQTPADIEDYLAT